MAKRKTLKVISKEVTQLMTNAKKGLLKGSSVQYNCGDGLTVIVNNGTGNAAWYARVGKKTTFLGNFDEMDYLAASDKVDELKTETKNEQEQVKHGPTANEFFNTYISHYAGSRKIGRIRTDNLKTIWKTTMYPLHEYKLKEITSHLVISKIQEIEQTPNNKHYGVSLLCNMLNMAREQKLIDVNPIDSLLKTRPSPFPLEKAKVHAALSPDEFLKIIVEPLSKAEPRYLPVYLICFLSGYFFREFQHMRWSLIDLKNKFVRLPVVNVQGKYADRYFLKPLSEPMIAVLQYVHSVNPVRSDYVFQSVARKAPAPFGDNSIREPWRRLVNNNDYNFEDVKSIMKVWLQEQTTKDPATGNTVPRFQDDLVSELNSRITKYAVGLDRNTSWRLDDERPLYEAWAQWLVKHLPKEFKDVIVKGREHPLKTFK